MPKKRTLDMNESDSEVSHTPAIGSSISPNVPEITQTPVSRGRPKKAKPSTEVQKEAQAIPQASSEKKL